MKVKYVVTLVQNSKRAATPASKRSPIVGRAYEWVEPDCRRDLSESEWDLSVGGACEWVGPESRRGLWEGPKLSL